MGGAKNSLGEADVDEEARVICGRNDLGQAELGAGQGAAVDIEGASLSFAAGSDVKLLIERRR